MVKNIILDVGMVLVEFAWEQVLDQLGLTGACRERVAKATALSPDWNELDRGILSDEEILGRFIGNAPEYEKEIRLMWEHTADMVYAYPYAEDFVKSLKGEGIRGLHSLQLSEAYVLGDAGGVKMHYICGRKDFFAHGGTDEAGEGDLSAAAEAVSAETGGMPVFRR